MAVEHIYFIFEANPTLQWSSIGKNPFPLASETLPDSIGEYSFNIGYTKQALLVSHFSAGYHCYYASVASIQEIF